MLEHPLTISTDWLHNVHKILKTLFCKWKESLKIKFGLDIIFTRKIESIHTLTCCCGWKELLKIKFGLETILARESKIYSYIDILLWIIYPKNFIHGHKSQRNNHAVNVKIGNST